MTTTIGILIFDDVEELDFAGPLEVFGMARRLGAECEIVTVAEQLAPLRCHYGLRVLPDVDFAGCPLLDLLLVPGGPGARGAARESPAVLDFVRRQHGQHASVCTGSLILAAAGLLRGRRATTHHRAFDLLAAYQDVQVETGVRYLIDQQLASSAGVSAGIDLALALVEQRWGGELASAVAERMEWDAGERWRTESR